MKIPDLHLSLIQSEIIWEDSASNLQFFESKIRDCEPGGLILLPETFPTGFSMNASAIAQTMEGPAVDFLRQQAVAHNSFIGGSLIIREKDLFFNRFVLASPSGELVHYDKRHLFRMADEHKVFSPGMEKVIVNVLGWKVLLQVCYDLRFPVFSRNKMKTAEEYDLCVYVANWPGKRIAHWKALLPARAIENQAWVAGLNRIGVDGNGMTYTGDSMVIAPDGEVLVHASYISSILSAQLSREKLETFREKCPAWQDADSFQTGK